MFSQQLSRVINKNLNVYTLALISFLESFLPLPILTDPFLLAGIAVKRHKALILTIVTTIASVVGGLLAYLSATFFWSFISQYLPSSYLLQFNELLAGDVTNTFLITMVGALTPVPYTFSAWAVALTHGNLVVFLLTSFFTRGLRYGILGFLTYKLGPLMTFYFNEYKVQVSILLSLLMVILIVLKLYLT